VHILVVDDDRVFREELSSLLDGAGHSVDTAPSAAKALETLERGPFDVVLTDLKMPRQSGLELLKEVRHRWPEIPVIVLTGYAAVPTAVEAMKLGALDYLAKPFRMDQLAHSLELVTQEKTFARDTAPVRDGAALARQIAEREKVPVLLAIDRAIRPHQGIEIYHFEADRLDHLQTALEGFLAKHPQAAFVLEGAEQLLKGRNFPELLDLFRRWRDQLAPVGAFAVGFDASKVTVAQAEAIRAVVAAPQIHGALEVLGNPIRRKVLRRLARGPASFSEAMHEAGIDDSPKMSFHLHRLVDEGLVARNDDDYRLTAKGQGVVAVLREMEKVASGGRQGNLVFETKSVPGSGTSAQ
jgi:DNA-binding response OmpR family regulator/DNA-binding HxlR family transcriptional regulator